MVITYHLHGAPKKKSFQCDFCRMSSPGPLQQQPMGTSAGCCVFTRKTWEIHGKTKGKPMGNPWNFTISARNLGSLPAASHLCFMSFGVWVHVKNPKFSGF